MADFDITARAYGSMPEPCGAERPGLLDSALLHGGSLVSAASAKPRSSLTPGRTIAERYVVQRQIGQGGMGHVLEVEHLALGRRFALKVLRLERWNDELVRRFNREARALARLSTPRVAQVTDFGIDPEFGPFYVMELLDGETLEDRLERDATLPAREALELCADLCEALTEVHAQGIIHRDLKPSNVGMPRSGPVRIKLLDFGLAAAMDDAFLSRITQSQQILGSLPYMSPEQFNGAEPSVAMDIYAVGIVLFETLTGRLPFLAPSTAALIHQILATPVPALPPEIAGSGPIAGLLERLLAKEASDRFATAAAAGAALRAVASATPGAPTAPPRAAHPRTRVLGDAEPAQAPASPVTPSRAMGMLPTLMAEQAPIVESGTRLASRPPLAPAPLAPAHGPIDSVAMPGYAPPAATDPMFHQVALPGPLHPVGHPNRGSPAGALLFRVAVVGLVGVILAGLTAIAVVVSLGLISDNSGSGVEDVAEDVAAAPANPNPPGQSPSAPGALEPTEIGSTDETPTSAGAVMGPETGPATPELPPTAPVEVREQREQPPTPPVRNGRPARPSRFDPEPDYGTRDPDPVPQVRPLAPRRPPTRDPEWHGDTARQW